VGYEEFTGEDSEEKPMKKSALLLDYLNAMDTVGHCDEVT
jgi:hypothetical protein